MLCAPSPDRITEALHAPPLAVVVPIGLPLSNRLIVGLAARLASLTVPAMVCVAWLVRPPPLVMATAGAVVSRVSASPWPVPMLPARSVACAVITLTPWPGSVIDVLQLPPLAVVVPIGLPLSNRLIVGLAARLASLTVPAMVCVAWLVIVPLLVMATAGAVVSRVSASLLLVPVLPARSVACAVITLAPWPGSVIDVLQLPPLAVVVPIGGPLWKRLMVGLAAR